MNRRIAVTATSRGRRYSLEMTTSAIHIADTGFPAPHDLFPPTRADGLERLRDFVPSAGRAYAAERNADPGPGRKSNVSMLSPYIRHRVVTEHEVVEAVLQKYAPSTAEKFIQEVFWRTYWKGWLQMRPSVWQAFVDERDAKRDRVAGNAGLKKALAEAEEGRTGIECFDDWVAELVATGYLHNHVRMWFASIWVFTLKLPWALGADFFLRHLIDGDHGVEHAGLALGGRHPDARQDLPGAAGQYRKVYRRPVSAPGTGHRGTGHSRRIPAAAPAHRAGRRGARGRARAGAGARR